MSGPANGAPSSGKDLCHVDALDSRVRFVWNTPSFSTNSKTKGLPHPFYCCSFFFFFNRLLLLVVSISRPVHWKNISRLRIFTVFYAPSMHFFIKSVAESCLQTFCCETACLLQARDRNCWRSESFRGDLN